MADLVIRIRADSQEALTRIQQFGRAMDQSFAQVKAGDPVLHAATLRVQQLTAAKGQATTAVQSFAAQMGALPGPVGQAAGALQGLVGLLTGPAGLVLGTAAAVAGLGLMVKSVADTGDQLFTLSQRTGASVETL